MDLRRTLRLHHQQEAAVRGRARRGRHRSPHLPYVHRRLGLQEDRKRPHRRGHTDASHGRARAQARRGRGVSPQREERVEHRHHPDHTRQRLLHRYAAPGQIPARQDKRPGHPARRGGADRHRKPPPAHHGLPHLRHGQGPAREAGKVQLSRRQDKRERLLRLPRVRRLRRADVRARPSRPQARLHLRHLSPARHRRLHDPPHPRRQTRRAGEAIRSEGA